MFSLWVAKNGSNEAGMWVATWGCDHEEASRAHATLSSASPRPEMSICALCSSNALTMCLDATERTQAYDNGLEPGPAWRQAGTQSCHRRGCPKTCRAASPHLDHPGTVRSVLRCCSLSKAVIVFCCDQPVFR